MNVKVIGLGGVGSHLISPICRHLGIALEREDHQVAVIDGDIYEARNAERQEFLDVGNKAEDTAARMRQNFPELDVVAKPHFVTEENIFIMVNSGDIVFMCVDNHATRKLVSDYCGSLGDVVLISGGNELTDGNVQIYIRKDGEDITPPLTHFHPEIEHPQDKNPADLSCEERARSGDRQIFVTNLAVSTRMFEAFWMVGQYLEGTGNLVYSDMYFDLVTGNTATVLRKPVRKERNEQ